MSDPKTPPVDTEALRFAAGALQASPLAIHAPLLLAAAAEIEALRAALAGPSTAAEGGGGPPPPHHGGT